MAGYDVAAKAHERLSLAENIPCSKLIAKPPPSAFDRMMTIIVHKKEFQMHRGLLCFHSQYFKNLLDGPFREGGSNKHALKDVSIDTFTMFYNWVYTGAVVDLVGTSDADLTKDDCIEIYAFADFHMVQQLKNRAVELFFMHMVKKWEVDITCSSSIYNKTTDLSRLRKLHVDILLETHKFENWLSSQGTYPGDFLIDLLETSRKLGIAPGSFYALKRLGVSLWIKEMSQKFCEKYHDHEESETYSAVNTTLHTDTLDLTECTCCGEEDHAIDDCPHRRARGGSIICYTCSQEGHIARNCSQSGSSGEVVSDAFWMSDDNDGGWGTTPAADGWGENLQ